MKTKAEGEDDIFKAIEKVIGKITIEKEELLEEANKKHNKKIHLNNICQVQEKYKCNKSKDEFKKKWMLMIHIKINT